jgi:Fe-S-cluster containining protein
MGVSAVCRGSEAAIALILAVASAAKLVFVNACQSCGACCVTYRVSFYHGEIDEFPGGIVPAGLTDRVTPHLACMRGTDRQPPRCVALRGEIGKEVGCAIYEFRPSPCREFAPLAAVGQGDEACNSARRRHGLPPLEMAASP